MLEKLSQGLAEIPWVDFAYLFGSQASGKARANSDVDVAVKVTGDPAARYWELLGPLTGLVPADKLHLVLFEQASSLLKQRIFRDGQLLFERDPARRKRYQVEALREFCDFQPRRDFFIQALKRQPDG